MLDLNKINELAQSGDDLKKAKTLATKRKWRFLETNKSVVWGEVKSSGAVYYKAQIFPKTLQYKCNCPSRKKPCIHILALMMRFVEEGDVFKITADIPDWVSNWLAIKDRPEKTERTEEEAKKLAAQRLKTREKRLRQMEEGLNELEIWLKDVVRQGLANLEVQPPDFWDGILGRLVNAKCKPIGVRIFNWQNLIGQSHWHERILGEIGELYLLLKGFKNIQQLPPNLQQELLNQAGINVKKEELLDKKGVQDTWLVIGQTEGMDSEGKLFHRRTWVAGEKSQKIALLLEFAWGNKPYETSFKPGNQFKGEVVFYPSSYDLRIHLRHFQTIYEPFIVNGYANFSIFLKEYAEAIGVNPWLLVFPAILEEVIPIYQKEAFFLIDKNKKMLPLKTDENRVWSMIALSGGRPITVFGQWEKQVFEPLSAILADQFILLKDDKPLPRPTRTWGNF